MKWVGGVACVVLMMLITSGLAVSGGNASTTPSTSGSTSVVASLAPFVSPSAFVHVTSVSNYSSLPYVSSTIPYYGVDVRADSPFTAQDALYLADTNVLTWRYPGGNNAEQYNYSTNQKEPNGTNQLTSISTFIQYCELDGCHAILQLPAEIDSPSTDAYYVSYIE